MLKIVLFIPIMLLGNSLMHPDDPKSRNHNSLGFGVTGDVVISNGVFYVGQTGSSLNNGSVYIYTPMAQMVLIKKIFWLLLMKNWALILVIQLT